MKKVKQRANKFRKEFGITGVPTLPELKNIIKKLNYKLKTYDESEALLKDLGQYEYSKHHPSFCCIKNKYRYVFYDDTLFDNDLIYILAHEIGHIYLNHIKRCEGFYDTSEYKEQEANNFAMFLTTPCKFNLSVIGLSILFLLIINIFIIGIK